MFFLRIAGLCLLGTSFWAVSAVAQAPVVQTPAAQTPEKLPTPEQITASIQEVDAATDLDDAKKASIRQLYQQAAADLEATGKATAEATRFEAMIQDAAPSLIAVTNQLKSSPKEPVALPDSLTLSQAQQKLAEIEAEELRARDELAKLNSEVAARQTRQREVPVELDAARKQLVEVNAQLATAASETESPLLTRARRTSLRIQAAVLTERISALEKELPAYAASGELLPKQRDLAGQKLSVAGATKRALLDRIDQLRRSDVSSQVEEAGRVLERTPDAIKSIAAATLDYTTQNQAILRQLKETTDSRSDTERILGSVTQEFKGTREKVESVGLTDALGILLRTKRDDLAELRGKYRADRTRRATVQTLQLQLLQLEDARTDLTQLDAATADILDTLNVDSSAADVRDEARKLLEAQRDALDSLLHNQRAYFESLVALDSAERELVQQIDEYTSYIEGWILWVRSAPPLGVSDFSNTVDAVRWLSSPTHWVELANLAMGAFRRRLLLTIIFGAAFVGLVLRQRSFRLQLRDVGTQAAPRRCREFAPTAKAVVLTAVIAASWPTLLFFIGWPLAADLTGTITTQALGWALVSSGAFLLLVESARQLLRPQGLSQSHFGWAENSRLSFARNLRWFSLMTPLVFLVVFLRIQPAVVFHQSFGRFCFLVLMSGSALLTLQTLRPGGSMFVGLGERDPSSLMFRLRFLVFALAVGMPFLLFALAAAGYYYSAYQLAQRLMESVALALALVIVTGVLRRCLLIHRRRLNFAQRIAARERAAQTEGSELQTDLLREAELAVDLVQVTRQSSELVRVAVSLAALVGGWWIWRDVLPALEFLASIEVWRFNLPNRIEIITLKHLFMSGVTFCLTFVAVKNVPGLLELLFLQRLPLDAGARYAVTTIVRYALAALGIIIGFSFIQVEWSQYGWLVAAATVGLGFGLQEIFANFVSGLIVLLERPIRVGDVVTVDGITGVVQRIHMRATVLRNWDYQELVVPNKEFVTSKLLNWTLSNSTNRVVITVGIAYGSDTDGASEILKRLLSEHPIILDDPAPSITFEQFGDSTLNFVIRCYLPQLDSRLATINELHSEIHKRFHAAGIEIAFPQQDIHLRTVPEGWQSAPSPPSQFRPDGSDPLSKLS